MIAVDTNVVVRLLVNDEPRQGAAARRLFEANEIHVPVTTLLEVAWVLGSVYELEAGAVAKAVRGLLGLPGVQVEDAPAVAAALDATEQGMEFADALHLLRTPPEMELATFDRDLAKPGRRLRPVRLL